MIRLEDLLVATGGRTFGLIHGALFPGFAYDSRSLRPGELFLAVKTDRADGHDYVLDACQKGAAGVLCERPPDLSAWPVTCVVVTDVRQALVDWAQYILLRQGADVVAITGSVGKTSTKEAIAAILATQFPVFRNRGNLNGRYGLPIALGEMLPEHEVAVLEIACDHFGEIRELANLVRPRVGVVTAIQPVHLEALGSLENIAEEKGHLVEALPPGGHAILNWDDPRVRAMGGRTQAQVTAYGIGSPLTDALAPHGKVQRWLWADQIAFDWDGLTFMAHDGDQQSAVRMPRIGEHNVYVGLAAIGAALACGLTLEQAASALSGLPALPGRLNPVAGAEGIMLLDDTYNASPMAALAALDALSQLPATRRIACLGDMLELGSFEEDGHRLVGEKAATVVDLLVTKGERARRIAEAAQAAGLATERMRITYTADDAIRALRDHARPGDAILLKGSAQTRMEEVTRALLADASRSAELLVRQGSAWEQVRRISPGRPTWVEIDLDAIASNLRRIKELLSPGVQVMAVLKADAYGHGAIKTARTALNNGASMLGVACLGEALALRGAGIRAPILVLGYTPPWQARETILQDVTATIYSSDVARALSRAAGELHATAHVHVKVDTGMGRLGLLPDQVLAFCQQLVELPDIALDGIFTHFAAADEADKTYTQMQLAAFEKVLAELGDAGINVPLVHAANSAAILEMPEAHLNMVRLGIAMYGLRPSSHVRWPHLRPALAFKTMIAQVKDLPAGSYVSYGCTYCTDRPSRIAVIPVGYADGFRRAPRHWGEVLVREQMAPIVGRVCMDQTMIDVTDIPGVREGDEVVLIGSQGSKSITAEDVAAKLGTINYEVISEILARVPRMT